MILRFSTGYSQTTQVANGGSVQWNLNAQQGASTGNVTLPPESGITSYAISSAQGTESNPSNIPSAATILGIQLNIKTYASAANTLKDVTAQLLKNGTLCANRALNLYLGVADGSQPAYGGSSDLWGTTWNPSDIPNIDWLFQVQSNGSQTCEAYVDGVNIVVWAYVPGASDDRFVPGLAIRQ
jgi:hypothetical protein